MSITRYSSRKEKLDKEFLAKALEGATRYLRIAGYFRSSIFELVGEQITNIPEVKIICNSELDLADFKIATLRETSLKERWNQVDVETESLLQQERYQKLDALLHNGNVEIRVVPKERIFIHGKAGSISYKDKERISFVGSVNDSKSAFTSNYELVWQDNDPVSADWVEEEFWALWNEGVPLSEAIVSEIHRVATRTEVTIDLLKPEEVPGATMAESPIYRGGEQLQPWQRSFVALFLKHREIYGKSRLLIADEVGLGKTLSLATSALISSLLDDGPVLILAPSTLTYQWQTELKDKLGISSAVWSSLKKVWIGVEGQFLSPKGVSESIKRCPYQIAIVSTGLIFHQREEREFIKEAKFLLSRKYGTVILDEAHKARMKGGIGEDAEKANNLLDFMIRMGEQTQHLLLGTATPIQTKVRELWDLLSILNSGAEFVLGDKLSVWRKWEDAVPIVKGDTPIKETSDAWRLLSNPLPPDGEHYLIDQIRAKILVHSHSFISVHKFEALDYIVKEMHLSECLEPKFFKENNPVLRHVVLRRRTQLEDSGLLEKVGVNTHPLPHKSHLYQSRFQDLGLLTNAPFEAAYHAAERFCQLLQQRTRSAGFMKSLMLQRICSSFASGLSTAKKMLAHMEFDEDEDNPQLFSNPEHILSSMSPEEVKCLKQIVEQLSREDAKDPKLETVRWFLTEFTTEGKTWLEHGCIIFSQYYDTANWVAHELAKLFPNEGIALYAGASKSGLFKGEKFSSVKRDSIKEAVKKRELRLVIATDAACEGLNLQTLGTLINIDLPWNPSRLEQRLGRIKRFGQARKEVDMLNLVYHETQDEQIYRTLSERLKDTFDIFGSLPDTIEDDWIDSEEELKRRIDTYMHERKQAENAFTIKYRSSLNPNENLWEKCSQVLSRRDIEERIVKGW
jgi:SNF2 family DNA or RNA helicase